MRHSAKVAINTGSGMLRYDGTVGEIPSRIPICATAVNDPRNVLVLDEVVADDDKKGAQLTLVVLGAFLI